MSTKLAQVLTGITVLAVAVFAAIVSFSHIESLALAHGQPVAAARLLPLSVDGLIVAASLSMLTEARAQREAPRLARAGLVLGVIATVLANVAFGARYGIVGPVISAWPAVSFVVSTEILLGQMRRARTTPAPEMTGPTVSDTMPGGVAADVPGIGPVDVPASTLPPLPVVTTRTVAVRRARGPAPVRKSKAPERIFAQEIQTGELPSLRQVKQRAHVGNDGARAILAELREAIAGQSVAEVAADL